MSSFWAYLSYAVRYRMKVVVKPLTMFVPKLLEVSGLIFHRNQQGRVIMSPSEEVVGWVGKQRV